MVESLFVNALTEASLLGLVRERQSPQTNSAIASKRAEEDTLSDRCARQELKVNCK